MSDASPTPTPQKVKKKNQHIHVQSCIHVVFHIPMQHCQCSKDRIKNKVITL